MFNWIKVSAIKATDFINRNADPFEEFTRPLQINYPEPLSTKAKRFEQDMLEHFMHLGCILNYRLPAQGQQLDVADQALWHGIYTAAFAFKYAVDPEATPIGLLTSLASGLQLHQTVHGEPAPRLIRGVYEDWKVQDNCSNDSASGHMAGIYFLWKYGPDELKPLMVRLMADLAAELIDNDYAFIGADRKPTTYGALIQGELTDPLRLTLCLAILGAAKVMTGITVFDDHFRYLFNKYSALIPYPKVRLMWIGHDYDTHRAALHLSVLGDLEPMGALRPLVKQGLTRIWDMEHKTGNAWIAYLCSRHITIPDEHLNQCRKALKEFSVEEKSSDREKINSTRTDIRRVLWDGKWQAAQPLPAWQRPAQDFEWQRGLHTLDGWIGNREPTMHYNGGDFLVAYWLGRLQGHLVASE